MVQTSPKFNENGHCAAAAAPGARPLPIALLNVVLLVVVARHRAATCNSQRLTFASRIPAVHCAPLPPPSPPAARAARALAAPGAQAPTPGVPWRRPRGHDDERAQRKPEPIMHASCGNGAGNVAPRSCCGTPSQGAGHNQFPPGPPR